ncbi:MAG: hypothetical protein ACJAYB_000080 [Psychromonas sp.]|jgi:hypothetical protein
MKAPIPIPAPAPAPTITKKQLVDLGACKPGFDRFIAQTGNTDQPVEIFSLIGGKNTTADFLWLAGKTLPKHRIVQFAVECAESVSHLHTDPRANAAIQSAKDWISEPSEVNRLKVCDAAYDAAAYAASAAYVASPAYCAADAAVSAVYAAYAAAYAAAHANANDAAIYADDAYAAAYTAAYAESNEVVQASLMKMFSE